MVVIRAEVQIRLGKSMARGRGETQKGHSDSRSQRPTEGNEGHRNPLGAMPEIIDPAQVLDLAAYVLLDQFSQPEHARNICLAELQAGIIKQCTCMHV